MYIKEANIRKEKASRIKIQDLIRAKYRDEIERLQHNLCPTCAFYVGCELIPVTVEGAPCPYFRLENASVDINNAV